MKSLNEFAGLYGLVTPISNLNNRVFLCGTEKEEIAVSTTRFVFNCVKKQISQSISAEDKLRIADLIIRDLYLVSEGSYPDSVKIFSLGIAHYLATVYPDFLRQNPIKQKVNFSESQILNQSINTDTLQYTIELTEFLCTKFCFECDSKKLIASALVKCIADIHDKQVSLPEKVYLLSIAACISQCDSQLHEFRLGDDFQTPRTKSAYKTSMEQWEAELKHDEVQNTKMYTKFITNALFAFKNRVCTSFTGGNKND